MKLEKITDENKIKYNVISINGDDKYEVSAKMGLNHIRNLVNDEAKWLYIDGEYTNVDKLTEADLIEASDITLTNSLGGGDFNGGETTAVVTEWKTDLKVRSDKFFTENNTSITLFFDEIENSFNININQGQLSEILKRKLAVVEALSQVLEGEAARFINDICNGVGEKPAITLTSKMKIKEKINVKKYADMQGVDLALELTPNKINIKLNEFTYLQLVSARELIKTTLLSELCGLSTGQIKQAMDYLNVSAAHA